MDEYDSWLSDAYGGGDNIDYSQFDIGNIDIASALEGIDLSGLDYSQFNLDPELLQGVSPDVIDDVASALQYGPEEDIISALQDIPSGYGDIYEQPSDMTSETLEGFRSDKFNAARDSEAYNKTIGKDAAIEGYRAPGSTPGKVTIGGKTYSATGAPTVNKPITHSGTNKVTGGKDGKSDWLKALLPLLLMMAMREKKSGGSSAVIPALTAIQKQTPYSQQRPEGYRPGQGGVRYFEPIQYVPRAKGGIMSLAAGGEVGYAEGGLFGDPNPPLDPNTHPNLGLFLQALADPNLNTGVQAIDDLADRQRASWAQVEAGKTLADRAWEFYSDNDQAGGGKYETEQDFATDFYRQFGPELYYNYFADRASETSPINNVGGGGPQPYKMTPEEQTRWNQLTTAFGGPQNWPELNAKYWQETGLTGADAESYNAWLRSSGRPSTIPMGNNAFAPVPATRVYQPLPAPAPAPATNTTSTSRPTTTTSTSTSSTTAAIPPEIDNRARTLFTSVGARATKDQRDGFFREFGPAVYHKYFGSLGSSADTSLSSSLQTRYDEYKRSLNASPVSRAGGGVVDLARALAAARREQRSRLLKGRGDGVSDSIPATIDGQRPARLARGEYVVDARTVAELGNGSTDAGAERLDEMRRKVHEKRRTAGVGKDSKAYRHLPA